VEQAGRGHGWEFGEDPDQALGLRIRQRAQENGVHHAKNRGSGSNTEGQTEDRGGRKAGILGQHAQAIAEVLRQTKHYISPGYRLDDVPRLRFGAA
jgi:hypothetical protein